MKFATILRTLVSLGSSPAHAHRSSSIVSVPPGSAVSRVVNYSGTLIDRSGKAVTKTEVAMFLIYSDATGGEPIWTETQNVYPDTNGHYSAVLGATTRLGLPENLFAAGEERWLAIQTPGEPESPRNLLATDPQALKPAIAVATAVKRNRRGRLTLQPSLQPFLTAAAIRISILSIVVLLALGNLFAQTSTSVPSLIHYSGTLAAVNGKPVTEPVGVTFLIYAERTGGEALWMETQMVRSDSTGHYTVELGAASQGMPADLFDTTENRWLATQAPGQLETARERLVSVPYALKAADAETLGGLPVSAFVLAGSKGKEAQPASAAPAPQAAAPAPSGVTSVALSAPASDFTVTSKPITKSGTLGFKWITPPTSNAVPNSIVKRDSIGDFWANDFTATGNIEAYGTFLSLKNANVYGSFLQGKSTKGIQMRNNGSGVDLESLGAPLFINWSTGQMTAFNGLVGVGTSFPQAELNLNSGGTANADTFLIGNNTTKGLQMRDNGTGVDLESIGVPLYVNYTTKQPLYLNPNGGSVNIGSNLAKPGIYLYCHAFCTGSVDAPGLLNVGAEDDGNGSYTSASFTNDVLILGNLLVEGTKDFHIDHPLDPLNKSLEHAAIESSEVLNEYSGNATLDANGEAVVIFPNWFSGINTDFRYQLTAVGAPGPNLYIAKKVENNHFTIAGGTPGMEVSWLITAKRNDAYMQAHPFQVERIKPEKMRGHYTHPELYGAKPVTTPVASTKP